MIRWARDVLLVNAGLGIAHHMLVLAARLIQVRDGRKRTTPSQAAVRYYRT